MPIYAYRCEACGFAKDVLQKMSDPQLTVCLSCNAPSFKKQLTAAGFQLKGTGWYATDFRNGANKPAAATEGGGADGSADKAAGDKAGGEAAASSSDGAGKGGVDKGGVNKSADSKPTPAAGTSAATSTAAGASSATPSSKV